MKIVFAPDSFKGSLSSIEVINILEKTSKKIFPNCKTVSIPIADGGEGTVDAYIKCFGGDIEYLKVNNPLYNYVLAKYGAIDKDTIVLEMAQASGLTLLKNNERMPLYTTTYGTGELIDYSLECGYKKIIIGIGGSATNDGGTGAMQALGVRFLDKRGNELEGIGKNLIDIVDIDVSNLNKNVSKAEIQIICDVKNPFTGKDGATYTYAYQKGASEKDIELLEAGMINYQNIIKKNFGIDLSKVKGSGAAGGLGGSLYTFLGAKLNSGIDIMLDAVNFDTLIEDADIVITGEGKLDKQSSFGKVISGVGKRCKNKNIPVLAIVGGMEDGWKEIYKYGISSVFSTVNGIMTLEDACENSKKLLFEASERMFRILKIGNNIKDK